MRETKSIPITNEMERLENIQKVPAPDALWSKVQQRIANQAKDVVPMHYARAIAIAVVLLFVANIYMVANNNNTETQSRLEEFVPQTEYSLYE
ncbi:MAG: hypothetical protein QMC70_08720 [Bacteroidia bacterium]|tara:strand:+ start:276 stop:554 length:279 start_codon:yes stop_codon:yes gene_type:complete